MQKRRNLLWYRLLWVRRNASSSFWFRDGKEYVQLHHSFTLAKNWHRFIQFLGILGDNKGRNWAVGVDEIWTQQMAQGSYALMALWRLQPWFVSDFFHVVVDWRKSFIARDPQSHGLCCIRVCNSRILTFLLPSRGLYASSKCGSLDQHEFRQPRAIYEWKVSSGWSQIHSCRDLWSSPKILEWMLTSMSWLIIQTDCLLARLNSEAKYNDKRALL